MDLAQVKTMGAGIIRPEGVMALDDGSLYTADGRGRCAHIRPDGGTEFFGNVGGVPNGICIDREGRCIVANIGNGEVQALSRDGRHEVLMTHADGRRMGSPNFPFVDSKGRIWVSNSTAAEDTESVLDRPQPDGSVVLIENGRARVVADGIYFANGLALDASETWIYVAQTMRRNILRYRIGDDGSLGTAEVFGPDRLHQRGFPDGIAFDEAGNLWVTFPDQTLNAVGYLTPAGELKIVLEDPAHNVFQRPTNICFGGKDRKTAFIGNLDGTTIPYFPAPYPGMRLAHQRT
ncbi:MAG: SMP-30/gluconolactonase/LRE family protein [Deltaproteobacteria bacterium]|nr:SMP-30/gluconolactonase/LRE family protein [Deltaproteobacteria bacterium]